MLKFYFVERTDHLDYDEYDSCVVVAENEDEAFKIAEENYYRFSRDYVEITEILLDKAKPVLGSYNAG